MKTRTLALLCFGLLTVLTRDGRAELVVNGSFESPPAAPGGYATYDVGSTAIPGWTVVSGANDPGLGSVDVGSFQPAHSGTQVIDLDGTSSPAAGGISQTLTGLTLGSSYVLDFYYSNNYVGTSASAQVTIGTLSTTITHSGATAMDSDFAEGTYTFVATDASQILTFSSLDPANDYLGIILDDVSVNPAVAVPEPTSFVMVGIGLLGVLSYSRRHLGAS